MVVVPHPHHVILVLLLCLRALDMAPTAAATAAANEGDDEGAHALLGLLQRVQSEALRVLGPNDFDPKLYVDLPLATDEGAAAAALAALPRPAPSRAELEAFLARYFGAAGSDLVAADPPDFDADPRGFLPRVESREARAWALEVHALWKQLARRVAPDVAARPERHTLLPLPGRVVVPGSRFREVYYWDSYWVVRGLLVSKMFNTAKEIVLNLVYLVEKYGFVLNGARSYYTNRSQPPLLSSMVLDIYRETGDLSFVRRAFPTLLKEHSFWMSEIHNVSIMDSHGRVHNLSRYQAMWNRPRPESATIDEELAAKLTSTAAKEQLYHQVASAAESGWDFSSRWMRNSTDMTTLATTFIIPVDLNTFIFKMELDIAVFAKLIGEDATSEFFLEASKARHIAIDSILWNSEMEQWLDYWLPTDGNFQGVYQWKSNSQNRNIFASNFVPLWLNAHHSGLVQFADKAKSVRVMRSLQASGLLHAAGIATSLSNTGQQWDFPNGWAPLQHLIAEGLLNSGSEEARKLATDIATRWVRTNYAAYKATGAMHEKYDVEACGKSGGGGEYKPQTGFGWSNGVVLSFLEEFGWPEDKEIDCARRGGVDLAGAESG
ncbi:probable trehalase [Phragmites australis]|uniref:probable trehalase n=1 Tax=Phragmites australis TaxID=29695 RepID=UPI002D772D61|nr:probable trehalase [Phragmites australis]